MKRLFLLVVAVLLLGSTALADAVRPVTLRVKEQEPELFLVQWRVGNQLPSGATPSPVLPDSCVPVGERSRVERGGTWTLQQTFRCPGGLAGERVGLDYPFVNVTIPTLVRVELLSGARYAHMLPPGESSWQVPAAIAGGGRSWLSGPSDAVLAGITHFVRSPAHAVFLLSLLIVGTLGTTVRLATAFTLAQLGGVVLSAVSGAGLSPAHAEIGVLVAAALLAREALRPAGERKQLLALAAGAGLVHGLGVTGALTESLLVVLGLDAALLVSLFVLGGARRIVVRRPGARTCPASLAYLVGGAGLALAVIAPAPFAQQASARAPATDLQLPELAGLGPSAAAASRRLAASRPDAAVQSFLAIEAFETRHEVLVRVRDFAERLELDPEGVLAVDGQGAIKERVRDLVTSQIRTSIDGEPVTPIEWRVAFLTVDANGALPRPSPVPETVATAWIGVTGVYGTDTTPTEVELTWGGFDLAAAVPSTVTDPESSRSVELTVQSPTLRWTNELAEDPAPVIRATAAEPQTLWVPLLAFVPLLAGVIVLIRGRKRDPCMAGGRVLFAVAVLLGPVGGVAWALPTFAGATPDASRARQILAGVLPNVYRSFEFPTESVAYDRLALTVAGPILRDVYLEHRRAVEMEERGGARVRVEAVEVTEVRSTGPSGSDAPGGFVAEATWTVGGTVTHFGHRHFRQNGYDARITLAPVDGSWKIHAIEVLDEKRLR